MTITALHQLMMRMMEKLKPPPDLTVSEWADRYRRLSKESSAQPGHWCTDKAPYQRAIMDSFTDPAIERIVLMLSSQVGKTEMINNIVGYCIHQDPGPILVVQPTLQMAETWSKDRLVPMLRDTPALTECVDLRSRRGGNTILEKQFPGGRIFIAGSNSPASLASRPIRIICLDEVDRFPFSAGLEGDPAELAIKRATTFHNRKIIMVSTPTVRGESRIERAYQASDQRRFYVPCPHCGHKQTLVWSQIRWPKDKPDEAAYFCNHCEKAIDEGHKSWMLAQGEWFAEGNAPGIAGFYLNELYSPWSSWVKMAKAFLEAVKSPDTLCVFVNTALAESFDRLQGEEVMPEEALISRCRDFSAEDYRKILVITAGIDVQNDRLEYEIIGWGEDEESWSLQYGRLEGDPAQDAIWERLDIVLAQSFDCGSRKPIPIRVAAMDTGGTHTDRAYAYVRSRKGATVKILAIKGSSTSGKPIINNGSNLKSHKIKLHMVGTDTAKDILFARLKIDQPGAGFCHFPLDRDEDYFKGLLSEKLVIGYKNGRTTKRYLKKTADIRNEPLDCRVYGLAALRWLQIYPSFMKVLRKRREKEIALPDNSVSEDDKKPLAKPQKIPSNTSKTHRPFERRRNFVNSWSF